MCSWYKFPEMKTMHFQNFCLLKIGEVVRIVLTQGRILEGPISSIQTKEGTLSISINGGIVINAYTGNIIEAPYSETRTFSEYYEKRIFSTGKIVDRKNHS